MKHCKKCDTTKELTEFYNDKEKKDGKASTCKECKNKKGKEWKTNNVETMRTLGRKSQAKYSASEKGRETKNKYKREWKKKNRNKENARKCVSRAIENKTISRPSNCSMCGGSSDRAIEAHHHSYKKENWLDVIWVCRGCHNKIHTK